MWAREVKTVINIKKMQIRNFSVAETKLHESVFFMKLYEMNKTSFFKDMVYY